MKIFVLEDMEDRIKIFEKIFGEHELTICDTADEAKEILGQQKFDTIFLDHDLGGEIYVDSDLPNTGYQVAKFIANQKISSQIIIHSMNYDGALNIKSILPHANILRFDMLEESIQIND